VQLSKVFFVLGLGSVLGVAGGVGAHEILPRSPVVRGMFIGGKRLPDGDSPATWLTARRDKLRDRVFYFVHGDHLFETTLGEAGIEVDIPATLALAEQVGHRGGPLARVKESWAARKGQEDVPLVWRLNRYRAESLFEEYAPDLYRDPVDARVDMRLRAKVADAPGQELDLAASLETLAAAAHTDGEVVDLVTRPIEAKVSTEDLIAVDITKTLASYETKFRLWGSGVGRSKNIVAAAAFLDGLVLAPGETLSFNDRVGARTLERGFTWAPEIQADELTTGVGGGTCQVSSTLHAAALFGALDVVDRRSHSRPSSYTKLGLDATVSYPRVDLKIRNTMTFPVMIHAFLPEEDKIRVDILGGDPVAVVDYKYGISHIEDFVRRITKKPHLPSKTRIRRQKGSRGLDVHSVVTVHYHNGSKRELTYYSGYRPAPEVYWISPDFEETDLPELPKHAKGVEGQLTSSREDYDDLYNM